MNTIEELRNKDCAMPSCTQLRGKAANELESLQRKSNTFEAMVDVLTEQLDLARLAVKEAHSSHGKTLLLCEAKIKELTAQNQRLREALEGMSELCGNYFKTERDQARAELVLCEIEKNTYDAAAKSALAELEEAQQQLTKAQKRIEKLALEAFPTTEKSVYWEEVRQERDQLKQQLGQRESLLQAFHHHPRAEERREMSLLFITVLVAIIAWLLVLIIKGSYK